MLIVYIYIYIVMFISKTAETTEMQNNKAKQSKQNKTQIHTSNNNKNTML